jgi:hypothetical protein
MLSAQGKQPQAVDLGRLACREGIRTPNRRIRGLRIVWMLTG